MSDPMTLTDEERLRAQLVVAAAEADFLRSELSNQVALAHKRGQRIAELEDAETTTTPSS